MVIVWLCVLDANVGDQAQEEIEDMDSLCRQLIVQNGCVNYGGGNILARDDLQRLVGAMRVSGRDLQDADLVVLFVQSGQHWDRVEQESRCLQKYSTYQLKAWHGV